MTNAEKDRFRNFYELAQRRLLISDNDNLTEEEQVDLMSYCIEFGNIQAEINAGKDYIVLIGNTGAGKSTMANYLSGLELEPENNEITASKKIKVKRGFENFHIGNDPNTSATIIP
jgi:ABC-type transport system involved in cytochrome bd biosynthesis fused ATPase/permease subunit